MGLAIGYTLMPSMLNMPTPQQLSPALGRAALPQRFAFLRRLVLEGFLLGGVKAVLLDQRDMSFSFHDCLAVSISRCDIRRSNDNLAWAFLLLFHFLGLGLAYLRSHLLVLDVFWFTSNRLGNGSHQLVDTGSADGDQDIQADQTGSIYPYDATGRMVDLSLGSEFFPVEYERWWPGIYFLVLTSGKKPNHAQLNPALHLRGFSMFETVSPHIAICGLVVSHRLTGRFVRSG